MKYNIDSSVNEYKFSKNPEKVIIKIRDLKKTYLVGDEKVRALRGIDLDIEKGETVVILGKSGSGKSTLLNMLAGLEKPTKGVIIENGQEINKMSEGKLAKFRQDNIGFVFQTYNLLPNLTALENVELPLTFQGIPKKIREKRALKLINLVGLHSRAFHKPTQMSGGQQQRVGIARAFATSPKIIFADEPTGNLDTATTDMVLNLMFDECREKNTTLIFVTHDPSISKYADKVVHVIDGIINKIELRKDLFLEGEEDAQN